MNATYFPDADRDNFGQELGLMDYDLRWHLGDRFTVLSDGFADVFGDGLKTVSGGVLINRPTLGNGYVGLRTINGPVTSNVLLGSFSYRLSEKWITTAGAAYDFANDGNIGQTFTVTRIGESMLVTLGVNVDASKGNVGFNFLIEPRFLPKLRLTQTTGIDVPPAGAWGWNERPATYHRCRTPPTRFTVNRTWAQDVRRRGARRAGRGSDANRILSFTAHRGRRRRSGWGHGCDCRWNGGACWDPLHRDRAGRRDVQHGDRAPGPGRDARRASRSARRARRRERRRARGGDWAPRVGVADRSLGRRSSC